MIKGSSKNYVLVSPARNEADYIEKTLESVIAQTIRPRRWIIVDDGSTDRTAEIVRKCARHVGFIELLQRPSRGARRDFASKVRAIEAAYQMLQKDKFDFFGNLDADIFLPPTYYEDMLLFFEMNPRLGIAGGRIVDRGDLEENSLFSSNDSVGCAVQLFRRQCYVDIGGYLPLALGGEDAAAEIMARMRGWEVRMFPKIRVVHLRSTGQSMGSVWRARYFTGVENYTLGYHPIFFFLKCLKRLRQSPRVTGSALMLIGYFWSCATRKPLGLNSEVVTFLRNEQKSKIFSHLWKQNQEARKR